ncbi:MAG: ankyrin repeat domain-containing protein [Bryobacteraceae bacterium]
MSAELFAAIRAGDAGRVAALLDADPALLDAKDENGLSAFTVARYSRQDAIGDTLLDRGARMDIFSACIAGDQAPVIELLAKDRGLVNSYSGDGWTPLHLAAFFSHKEIAEVLLANGADANARSRNAMGNTPLHAAVAARKPEVVPVLLAHGADVNVRQQGGFVPLHAAAQNGDVELARLLIANGADVKARADNNQNALDLAMTKGHQAMVDLLDRHGAAQ